jgi:hypothetical protein
MDLKRRLEAALLAQMPWSHALDVTERAALLKLIRKMTKATAAVATPPAGAEGTEEVGTRQHAASPAAT